MATKVKPSRLQVSGTPQAGQVPVYVDEDCFQWCAAGGCAQWGCITGTLCNQTDLQGALDCKQDKACMVCNLTSPDDSHYPSAKAVADAMACAGTGDMLKSVYDPNNVEADVYDYCNLINTPTIPTNNNQLANGCGYTTCTGTVSTCADVISALGYTPYSTGNPCNYINNFAGVVSALGYTPYNTTNPCGYTTCTGTLVASDLTPYAKTCILCTVSTSGKYCDLTGTPTIPTDNCQLSNGCGYTTCTGTISTCSQIISTLGYTPYNSTNPNGYTTCTGTLSADNAGCCGQVLTKTTTGACWCDPQGGGGAFDSTPYLQCEYDALPASKNTDCIRRLIYE